MAQPQEERRNATNQVPQAPPAPQIRKRQPRQRSNRQAVVNRQGTRVIMPYQNSGNNSQTQQPSAQNRSARRTQNVRRALQTSVSTRRVSNTLVRQEGRPRVNRNTAFILDLSNHTKQVVLQYQYSQNRQAPVNSGRPQQPRNRVQTRRSNTNTGGYALGGFSLKCCDCLNKHARSYCQFLPQWSE